MSDFRAAYRYALALIEVAGESDSVGSVSSDLEFIESIISRSREFRLFLRSPVVGKEKKKEVLRTLLKGKISDMTMTFVQLLAAKNREELLPEVIRQYRRLQDERLGILNVTARTAVPLNPGQEQQLVAQLERATKKKVRMSYVHDPSLKGGFSVQHEDTVWDASVRRQLELMRERLAEGT